MDLIKIFSALSEKIRLDIITLLLENEELCVCDFIRIFKISQPRLSFHLKILRDANLVRHRKVGKWVYYSIDDENEILNAIKPFIKGYKNFSYGGFCIERDKSC